MMNYTEDTKNWLDKRFARDKKGNYRSHQPIYGFGTKNSERGKLIRLARNYSLFRILSRLDFHTFLDVGGAEGYTCYHVRKLFKAKVFHTDLSFQACVRCREIFGIPSLVCNSSALPFKDNYFDVVFCSEVIEHVEYPVETLLELLRVAKKYVVLSTQEFCASKIEQYLQMNISDRQRPHSARNYFIADDFIQVWGSKNIRLSNEFSYKVRDYEINISNTQNISRVILRMCKNEKLSFTSEGVIVVKGKKFFGEDKQKITNKKILKGIVNRRAIIKENQEDFKEIVFQCPTCSGKIVRNNPGYICRTCNKRYLIKNKIPIILNCYCRNYRLNKKQGIVKDKFNSYKSQNNTSVIYRGPLNSLKVLKNIFCQKPLKMKYNFFLNKLLKRT